MKSTPNIWFKVLSYYSILQIFSCSIFVTQSFAQRTRSFPMYTTGQHFITKLGGLYFINT